MQGGISPSLSMFNLGGNQQFQHIGKLAGYVRAKVSGMISNSVNSLYKRFTDKQSTKSNDTAPQPISSVVDFDDKKRRILRMTVDPYNKLIATCDSVGRVLLYDKRLLCVIRVWKGLRDAKLSWIETSSRDSHVHTNDVHRLNSNHKVSLATYSPRIGIVQILI